MAGLNVLRTAILLRKYTLTATILTPVEGGGTGTFSLKGYLEVSLDKKELKDIFTGHVGTSS